MGVLWVLGVLAAVLAVWGVYREARSRARHGWHRLAWRWVTGAAWHGQAVSDQVWTWPGPWFWRMGRHKRAAVRLAVTLLVLSLPFAWAEFPQVTAYALLGVAICGLVLSIGMSVWLVVTWCHHRRWTRPLHLAAHQVAGIGRSQSPRSWITIERDRSRAVLRLPQ